MLAWNRSSISDGVKSQTRGLEHSHSGEVWGVIDIERNHNTTFACIMNVPVILFMRSGALLNNSCIFLQHSSFFGDSIAIRRFDNFQMFISLYMRMSMKKRKKKQSSNDGKS